MTPNCILLSKRNVNTQYADLTEAEKGSAEDDGEGEGRLWWSGRASGVEDVKAVMTVELGCGKAGEKRCRRVILQLRSYGG
jgi:hypothetical protein